MQKYQILKKLGQGTFGNVQKAQNLENKQIVAIKKLKKKYGTWEQCLQLSQVKALRKIIHPNIIKLKQMIRVMNDAFLIFEFIDHDLLKLINDRKQKGKSLENYQIKTIIKQLTQALACTHKTGFFHRDIKPENVLISTNLRVKIIDFGIARQIRSMPPFTEYISTRWYRAPEILFRFPTYSAPVDIFALGCLLAEMYLKKPLFQGNSEMDQISKICSVIGSPTMQNWPEGFKHAVKKGINFAQYTEIPLSTVIPDCPKDALDFISQCIKWDPTKRLTASQLLNHPFLTNIQQPKLQLQPQPQNNQTPPKQSPYIKKQQIPSKNNKNYRTVDKDDQLFEELINSLENKFKSTKNDQNDDKDDW